MGCVIGGVVLFPTSRLLAVGVLSLDGYIGFAVPCRFHTIRAVKFSVTVVSCSPAAKRAPILEYFPFLTLFFFRLYNEIQKSAHPSCCQSGVPVRSPHSAYTPFRFLFCRYENRSLQFRLSCLAAWVFLFGE